MEVDAGRRRSRSLDVADRPAVHQARHVGLQLARPSARRAAVPQLRARRRRRRAARHADGAVPVGPAAGAVPAQRARRALGGRAPSCASPTARSRPATTPSSATAAARSRSTSTRPTRRGASGSGPRSASTTARRSATSATSSGTSCGCTLVASDADRLAEFRDLFGDERRRLRPGARHALRPRRRRRVARRPRLVLRLGPPVGGLRRVVGPADARPRRRRDRRRVGRRAARPTTAPTPPPGWRRRSRPASPPTSWPARWGCATSTRSP